MCKNDVRIIRIDIIGHRIIELPCLYVSLVFSELNTAIAGLNKLKYPGQLHLEKGRCMILFRMLHYLQP